MGPQLYNALPHYLRTINNDVSLLDWKSELDNFLSFIPDHPITVANESGLCKKFSAKQTNSLISWIPVRLMNSGSSNGGFSMPLLP